MVTCSEAAGSILILSRANQKPVSSLLWSDEVPTSRPRFDDRHSDISQPDMHTVCQVDGPCQLVLHLCAVKQSEICFAEIDIYFLVRGPARAQIQWFFKVAPLCHCVHWHDHERQCPEADPVPAAVHFTSRGHAGLQCWAHMLTLQRWIQDISERILPQTPTSDTAQCGSLKSDCHYFIFVACVP